MNPLRIVTSDIALVYGMGAWLYIITALCFPKARHAPAVCAVVGTIAFIATLEYLLTGSVS